MSNHTKARYLAQKALKTSHLSKMTEPILTLIELNQDDTHQVLKYLEILAKQGLKPAY